MRVGPELRQWLDDREAQRRARADADRFTTAWNAGPIHRLFADATASAEPPTAEAVADAIAPLFRDQRIVEAVLDALAEPLRDDPFFQPSFRHLNSEIHSGLILYEDERVSVAAGVTDVARLAGKKRRTRGRGSIAFSGQVELLHFVKAGGARLSVWEAPRIGADFQASAAGKCRQTGERVLEDGETMLVDGRHQSFVIEHAVANLLILQATVKPDQAPLSVEYDSLTREYVGCSAADDSASRIQMLATLLRKLGHAAAFPEVAQFLDHPSFFVRWHVMRELLGLDAETALPHLRRMAAQDPHPETRRAARTVLDRIGRPGNGDRKAA
jgi:hypothetical protein